MGPGFFQDDCPLPAAGLNLAAPLASPHFTGVPLVNGQPIGTGSGGTPPSNAPLLGTNVSGAFQAITLGTNLSLNGTTLNATGGGGGGTPTTWPSSGSIIVSNGTYTPSSLAPVNNTIIYATGGAWTTLAAQANSVLVYNSLGVPSASTTLPSGLTIPGYLTGNQNITLSGDISGSGTTAIAGIVNKVNGVAYPASAPLNTVPVVTSAGNVSYLNAGQLAGTSGFGSMLQQNANAVAITGGSIAGTTISGAANTISNIANSSLTNSSMTLAGHSVSLGGTQAFAIGDLSNIGNSTIVGNNSGSAGPPLALSTGAISTMLGLGTMASQSASAVAITGGSVTGLGTPSGATDAATKGYVDTVAASLVVHTQVAAATAAALPNTPTYSNGSSGVGATLTSATNTALVVDGQTISATTTRILVKNEATAANDGIYTLTQAGTGSVPWILTRATDFNTAATGNIAAGAYVFVTTGTANAATGWQMNTSGAITVGTTALNWVQFLGNTAYTADGTTISLTGNQFAALPNGILSAVTSTPNSLLARGASTWAGVAPVDNAVLATNGSGVPSESTTLPSGLTIPGYLTGNQSITLSGAISGSGATAITTTLASIADGTLLSNTSGGSAAPSANSLSSVIDHDIGSAANNFLVRGASTWGLMASVNNAVVATNSSGVPSESTTLPSGLTIPGYLTGLTGGPGVSITGSAPNLTVSISTASADKSGAAYTVLTGDNGSWLRVGNFTYTLAQAGSTGFSAGWNVCFINTGTSGAATINTITSLFNGASGTNTLALNPGDWACPLSDGANYTTPVGHYTGGGSPVDSVTTGIAAAGTTQGTATLISSQQNYVATGANCASFPTCSGSAGVRLNASLVTAGGHVYVTNEDASNGLVLYPPSGDTINNLAANTAIYIQANQTAHLIAKSSSALRSVP